MNYADFFTNVRELCTRINRPPEDLGFNPFALMSDMYYRENFHSDIIRAILDPNGPHRENGLFLLSFVNLLAVLAVAQNKLRKSVLRLTKRQVHANFTLHLHFLYVGF